MQVNSFEQQLTENYLALVASTQAQILALQNSMTQAHASYMQAMKMAQTIRRT